MDFEKLRGIIAQWTCGLLGCSADEKYIDGLVKQIAALAAPAYTSEAKALLKSIGDKVLRDAPSAPAPVDIEAMHAAFVKWAASKDGGNYKDGNYLPRSDFGWAAYQEGVRRGRAAQEPGKAENELEYVCSWVAGQRDRAENTGLDGQKYAYKHVIGYIIERIENITGMNYDNWFNGRRLKESR